MSRKFIGVTLPIRLGQTGMFEQSTTLLIQTRSNFKNLILTKKGERLSQPELGCDLWNVLFEPANADITNTARAAVESSIERWMPYIELVDFELTTQENTLQIKSSYRFKDNPNLVDQVEITTSVLNTALSQFNITTRGRTPGAPRGLASENNPSTTIEGSGNQQRRRITFR